MSFQGMDADTAETLAGVVRLLRRAAELVWAAVDAEGAGSLRQVLALGIDLSADEARNVLPDAIAVQGPVSALARETLLDATLEQAPAMVRSWNQLVGSAVELWAVLPSAPNGPSWSDPMERLRAIGEAISRSVTAGHWPGQGPTEEHLTQIADNLSHAQHLVERSGGASQSPTDSPADLQHAPGQVMHTLYVAAYGTVVALGAYAADLQGEGETAGRRRQPIAERPTALEVSAARGMIARFDGFERLAAAAYLVGEPPPSSMNPWQAATPTKRLETALAAWEVQAHRTLAARPDPADLVRVARVQALITSTTSILTEAAARKGPPQEDQADERHFAAASVAEPAAG
jgi:hypothetical protein